MAAAAPPPGGGASQPPPADAPPSSAAACTVGYAELDRTLREKRRATLVQLKADKRDGNLSEEQDHGPGLKAEFLARLAVARVLSPSDHGRTSLCDAPPLGWRCATCGGPAVMPCGDMPVGVCRRRVAATVTAASAPVTTAQ